METKLVKLYHGSSFENVRLVVRGQSDLIGVRIPTAPNYSGSLTNQFKTAEISTLGVADPFTGMPIVLTFEIPEEELIDEGPIGHNDETVRAFSTIHEITPEELPQEYFDASGYTAEEAKAKVDSGRISFHRIPSEYLTSCRALEPLLG